MEHSSVLTRYHTDAQKNTFDGAKMKTRAVRRGAWLARSFDTGQ